MASDRSRKPKGRLRRDTFGDGYSYAEAAYHAGADYDDLDELRRLSGEYGDLLRAIWGSGQDDLDAEAAAGLAAEQKARPDLFVKKLRIGRRKKTAKRR